MLKKTFLILLFSLFIVPFKAQNWLGIKVSRNNIITVKRQTANYDKINIGGPFNVELVAGKEGAILIEGDKDIIPYIETEVYENTLKVKYKKKTNTKGSRKLTVIIPVETISNISFGGSGQLTCKTIIKANNLTVSLGGSGMVSLNTEATTVYSSIGGSGNIELSGKTSNFKCSIAGSGNIKATNFKTDNIDAKIAGSGNINCYASKTLKAKIVGSGNIYYKGNPTIESKSLGSGDVINNN